jgi:hypothetical protein
MWHGTKGKITPTCGPQCMYTLRVRKHLVQDHPLGDGSERLLRRLQVALLIIKHSPAAWVGTAVAAQLLVHMRQHLCLAAQMLNGAPARSNVSREELLLNLWCTHASQHGALQKKARMSWFCESAQQLESVSAVTHSQCSHASQHWALHEQRASGLLSNEQALASFLLPLSERGHC